MGVDDDDGGRSFRCARKAVAKVKLIILLVLLAAIF